MTGLIAIEEAFQVPELANQALNHAQGETAQRLAANLVDIHDQRLKYMDQEGVDFQVFDRPQKLTIQVLSLTSPGPQGLSDPTAAETLAQQR
jgi:2,3-dihydroxybenzoate decarboxylase